MPPQRATAPRSRSRPRPRRRRVAPLHVNIDEARAPACRASGSRRSAAGVACRVHHQRPAATNLLPRLPTPAHPGVLIAITANRRPEASRHRRPSDDRRQARSTATAARSTPDLGVRPGPPRPVATGAASSTTPSTSPSRAHPPVPLDVRSASRRPRRPRGRPLGLFRRPDPDDLPSSSPAPSTGALAQPLALRRGRAVPTSTTPHDYCAHARPTTATTAVRLRRRVELARATSRCDEDEDEADEGRRPDHSPAASVRRRSDGPDGEQGDAAIAVRGLRLAADGEPTGNAAAMTQPSPWPAPAAGRRRSPRPTCPDVAVVVGRPVASSASSVLARSADRRHRLTASAAPPRDFPPASATVRPRPRCPAGPTTTPASSSAWLDYWLARPKRPSRAPPSSAPSTPRDPPAPTSRATISDVLGADNLCSRRRGWPSATSARRAGTRQRAFAFVVANRRRIFRRRRTRVHVSGAALAPRAGHSSSRNRTASRRRDDPRRDGVRAARSPRAPPPPSRPGGRAGRAPAGPGARRRRNDGGGIFSQLEQASAPFAASRPQRPGPRGVAQAVGVPVTPVADVARGSRTLGEATAAGRISTWWWPRSAPESNEAALLAAAQLAVPPPLHEVDDDPPPLIKEQGAGVTLGMGHLSP